jgi:hypothetical protein
MCSLSCVIMCVYSRNSGSKADSLLCIYTRNLLLCLYALKCRKTQGRLSNVRTCAHMQETRLNHRSLSMRAPAQNAIMRLRGAVSGLFREALSAKVMRLNRSACLCMCVCVCVCVYIYICTCIHTYIHMCVYIYICVCVCTYIRTYVCV